MGTNLLPAVILSRYEVHEWEYGCAILHQDFPAEWVDIIAVLNQFRLLRSQLVRGCGSKSDVSSPLKTGWLPREEGLAC